MKQKKKRFKILGILILIIFALFLLTLAGLHLAKYFMYPEYYSHCETVSSLPALNGGFVPQGLGYDAASNTYLHSGYNSKSGAVELYLTTNDETKRIYPIYYGEYAPASGHGGGIAVAGDYVYVADNVREGNGRFGEVNIFRFSDLQNAKDGDQVKAIGSIAPNNSASFCFTDGSFLYVGEFYRAGAYETVESHRFTTPAGDQNNAILTAYALNTDGSLIVKTPVFCISITDQVQGFAISKGGKIVLSRSWGLNPSTLSIYDGWLDVGATITVDDRAVPLYYLDSSTHQKDIVLPAFSEGLAIGNNGKLLISFESACNKYFVGKLFFANKVVSYPVS